MSHWTLFSNYGHVLVCLARDNESRLRDVATDVGITERAVQKIVRELQDEGYITVRKHGRRNRYRINTRKGLRHSLESHCSVGKLLGVVKKPLKPAEKAALEDEAEEERFEPAEIVDEAPEHVDYTPPDVIPDVAADPVPEPDSNEDSSLIEEPEPSSVTEENIVSSGNLSESAELSSAEETDEPDPEGSPPIDIRQQRSLF